MEAIQVERADFNKIIRTAEILIDEVEQVFQDEIVKSRMGDVVLKKTEGKTEEDYNEYLRKRSIECSVP